MSEPNGENELEGSEEDPVIEPVARPMKAAEPLPAATVADPVVIDEEEDADQEEEDEPSFNPKPRRGIWILAMVCVLPFLFIGARVAGRMNPGKTASVAATPVVVENPPVAQAPAPTTAKNNADFDKADEAWHKEAQSQNDYFRKRNAELKEQVKWLTIALGLIVLLFVAMNVYRSLKKRLRQT